MKKGSGKVIVFVAIGIVVVAAIIAGILLLGREKVSPISEQCAFACEAKSTTGFCSVERKVEKDLLLTCETLATDSQYSKYGVEPCSAISCSAQQQQEEEESSPEGQTCAMIGGEWTSGTTCPEGKFKLVPSDSAPEAGMICCG